MSKKTLYILGILLTIAISTFFHQRWCCCECDKAANKEAVAVTEAEKESPTRNGFAISATAGDGLDYTVQDNYNFNVSSAEILEPLAESVTQGVAQAKSYLDANPNQEMTIVGHYSSSETNSSAFPNLGLARATAVKNHMVAQGIPAKLLYTSSKLNDDFVAESGVMYGPVTFGVKEGSAEATDWEALRAKIQADPLVLYFNTGQASINLSAEQRQKVADLSNYLDHVDDAKCLVIGHTDSKGNRSANVQLGLSRAQFAKDYLVKNGINTQKIEASSKGPDEPTADNATEEGRAKNRRTVVTLN